MANDNMYEAEPGFPDVANPFPRVRDKIAYTAVVASALVTVLPHNMLHHLVFSLRTFGEATEEELIHHRQQLNSNTSLYVGTLVLALNIGSGDYRQAMAHELADKGFTGIVERATRGLATRAGDAEEIDAQIASLPDWSVTE